MEKTINIDDYIKPIEETYEYKRGYFQAMRDVMMIFVCGISSLEGTLHNFETLCDVARAFKNSDNV